ncbi:hypothetical protein RIF23_09005 [Lipingzhangella sp. LS1_29]|uniref:Uncharacterized protein n=2 Tax=Lipingzhangella rawalii TaxID=2055835 RepID=A0ABU2H546_9ACTN|nr:hypothetical protein [Lipingzhangella rawalii]
MRVYLPSTLPALGEILAEGGLNHVGTSAYAVTPALRHEVGDDAEELAYAALCAAADASVDLVAADPQAPRRRLVLAADVHDDAVRPGAQDPESPSDATGDPAAVTVHQAIPLKRIVSGHVDAPDADVIAAVEHATTTGELEVVQDYELLWYATQELAELS